MEIVKEKIRYLEVRFRRFDKWIIIFLEGEGGNDRGGIFNK